MTRVVIEVHQDPQTDKFEIILSEPDTIEDGWDAYAFPCTTVDEVAVGFVDGVRNVMDMGGHLVTGLRSHPAVRTALDVILAAPPAADVSPIYVRVTPDSEGLPWETLFDKQSFLALDRRWPIARMGREGNRRSPTIDFVPPLRVLAVLAAAGVDATDEWEVLLKELRGASFPVTVKALIAQDDLRVTASKASGGNVTVLADTIPEGRDIIDVISAFRPNILHFFSHGRQSLGFSIEIATRASWHHPDQGGHVLLGPKDLATKALTDSVWVVTLNVCKGAKAGGSGSLVYSLVASGFASVAGMREPEDEHDAHAFTKGFYKSLMGLLGEPQPGGPEVELDLARAMYEPRMEICQRRSPGVPCLESAMTSRAWTLPVLYARPSGIAIRRHEAPAAVAVPVQPGDTGTDAVPEIPTAAVMTPEEADRAALETKLAILKDLLVNPLPGTHDEATAAYRHEIARLQAQLYPSQ